MKGQNPEWEMIHPRANIRMVGYLPGWLFNDDPRKASEQLHQNYLHGGGWRPFKGFELDRETLNLLYPGDPPTLALAKCKLRDETIVFYQHSWVGIIQDDWSFEVCRMD